MNRYQSEKGEVIHELSRRLDLNSLQRSLYTEDLGAKSNRLYFQSLILPKSYPNRIDTIRIWLVATGECIRVLTNHTDLVNFVVFHPDAEQILLASCSHDETIRLWDTDFWICIKVLRPQRIYEGMNIAKITGITTSQVDALMSLGAIDK